MPSCWGSACSRCSNPAHGDSDTLQLIFLAIVCGIAVGKIGEYSAVLRELFDALYSMFLAVTNMFTKLMPYAVFASMTLLAVAAMFCVYGLLVLVLGRCSPIMFYRKNWFGHHQR